MPTAFGQAMLASVAGHPQRFSMKMGHDPAMAMSCREFMHLRPDEEQLLESISLPHSANVLDYGCGIGRHFSYVRQANATARLVGIEICDLMLDHCRRIFTAPATFVSSFAEVSVDQFDLIMLMGNGLGVLGGEQQATAGLELLISSLRPGGRIVIETGNPFGAGYLSRNFTIDYHGQTDGPFTWGYSDRTWISETLARLGCTVAISESCAPGGSFFFVVAQKS
ncbi:MAG: class I SAM-dependent methyltransferase [Rhodoferax sp.]